MADELEKPLLEQTLEVINLVSDFMYRRHPNQQEMRDRIRVVKRLLKDYTEGIEGEKRPDSYFLWEKAVINYVQQRHLLKASNMEVKALKYQLQEQGKKIEELNQQLNAYIFGEVTQDPGDLTF